MLQKNFDISNCHPNIALQAVQRLAREHYPGLAELPSLTRYCADKDGAQQLVADAFHDAQSAEPCSARLAKELLLRVLNGGTVRAWMLERRMRKSGKYGLASVFIEQFRRDAQICCAVVAQSRGDLLAMFSDAGRDFPELTTMSYFLCELEDMAIQLLEQGLSSRGMQVSALCFDGCLIRKVGETPLEAALAQASEDIWEALGLRLEVLPKPWGAEQGCEEFDEWVARKTARAECILPPPGTIFQEIRSAGESTADILERLPNTLHACLAVALLNLLKGDSLGAQFLRSLRRDGPFTYEFLIPRLPGVALSRFTQAESIQPGKYILHQSGHAAGIHVAANGWCAVYDANAEQVIAVEITQLCRVLQSASSATTHLFLVAESAEGETPFPQLHGVPAGLAAGADRPAVRRHPKEFKSTIKKLAKKRPYTQIGVDKWLRGFKWFKPSKCAATKARHACSACGSFNHKMNSHVHGFNSLLKHNLQASKAIVADARKHKALVAKNAHSGYKSRSAKIPGSYSSAKNKLAAKIDKERPKPVLRRDGSYSLLAIAKMDDAKIARAYCGKGALKCKRSGCGGAIRPEATWRCSKPNCKSRARINIFGKRLSLISQIAVIREFVMISSVGRACANTGLNEKTVMAAYRDMRRCLAKAKKNDQESITYPAGASCEADEMCFGKRRLQDGGYACQVLTGFVQRGATFKTLYLQNWGSSKTKEIHRFPKVPDEKWRSMWMENI